MCVVASMLIVSFPQAANTVSSQISKASQVVGALKTDTTQVCRLIDVYILSVCMRV